MRRMILISIIGLLVIPISCGLFPTDSDDKSAGDGRSTPNQTPPVQVGEPINKEAALMAMWHAETLLAPESLYHTIKMELAQIRSQWLDSLTFWTGVSNKWASPGSTIGFYPPWHEAEVWLLVSPSLAESIRNGNSREMTAHLRRYRAQITDYDYAWGDSLFFSVKTEELYNPLVMAKDFGDIAGIWKAYVETYRIDGSNVFRLQTDGTTRYFFNFRWGDDCVAGCTEWHVLYFQIDGDSSILLDSWPEDTDGIRPEMIDTLKILMKNFNQGLPGL